MADLFPYQETGAAWIAPLPFAILGDQPRVGKTPQVVRALDMVAHKVGIVCPAIAVGVWEAAIERWSLGLFDFTIQSYNIAARDGLAPGCDTYVFDEAHRLANIASQRTQRLLGHASPARKAKRVWVVSGSIAKKHVGNLYPWLRFAGLFDGGNLDFLKRFTNYRETRHGPRVMSNKASAMPELKAILAPIFLRRTRAEVFPDQPPTLWGDILLRGPKVESSEINVANTVEIYDDLPTEDEHLATLRRLVGEAKAGPLAEFLADELDEGEGKMAIYGWHSSVLDILEQGLSRFGVVRIDGRTSAAKRTQRVAAFQNDPTKRVVLGQIIAAGEAVDLSDADNLVLAEMSWTAEDNAQAAARLGGPNQKNATLIRTATLKGSIDEAVNGVVARETRNLMQLYGEAA